MLKSVVVWSVYFKKHEKETVKLFEIAVDSDDLSPKVYNTPDPELCSFVFQLRDNPELAKSLSTSSVTMPWVKIQPDGTEIQLSKQEKHLIHEYYSKVDVQFKDYDVHTNQEIHCGQCLLFSREKGQEILNLETHTFADGDKGKMNTAIVDALAETHGRPTLTSSNVGYCPKHRMLCADVSPGCDEPEPIA